MNSGKALVTLSTGIVIGSVAGVLLAVYGQRRIAIKKEGRKELSTQVNELIVNITRRFDAMKEETARITERTNSERTGN